ncbi:hypothetical protein QQA02_01740 [Corynebacterium sp. MSK006]|uniref:hypothetical protein n=1 Tax=Corynebacterium sp. MSK006 TaxID=3050187 RepID=UPI002551A36F|nr:hypothetical protein [Corynebacterium sp. MSK006]MDK8894442.1 hypothetical protein [Corynebacterium sp. MSK006]
MAHYNLYESIGLDRGRSSEELAAEVTRRLNEGETGNPGGADELQVALDIFSEPSRRSRYDAILDDPSQPELRVGGLRRIAAEDAGSAGEASADTGHASQDQQPEAPQAGQQFGQYQRQPEQGQQPQQSAFSAQAATAAAGAKKAFAGAGEKLSGASENLKGEYDVLKGEYAKSSRKAIIVTAIVTAVACLLLFGIFNLVTGGSGSEGGKSVKMAKELVKKDTDRDRVDWISEHSDKKLTEKFTDVDYDAEALNDRFTDFVGVGSADVLDDVDYGTYRNITMTVDDEPFFKAAESDAGVTAVPRVSVGDKDAGVPKAHLTFAKMDGDWYLVAVNKVFDADEISGSTE